MKNRIALVLMLLTVACQKAETPQAPAGNAARGRELIAQYGCNVCHTIPGIDGPQGSLGPALAGVSLRPTISMGKVPNTPANLVQFIQNPASLNPQSSMPPLAIPPADAQDIAAYLATLR